MSVALTKVVGPGEPGGEVFFFESVTFKVASRLVGFE